MARTLDIRSESRFAKDHDRNEWVAATAILSLMIRSSMPEPPWPKVGFVPDNETPLYDRRTDFNEFIFKKAEILNKPLSAPGKGNRSRPSSFSSCDLRDTNEPTCESHRDTKIFKSK